MKKFLLQFIAIAALVSASAVGVFAATSIATQTSAQVVGSSFVATYSVKQAPATASKVYLWVGELSKTPGTWISQNKQITTLPATAASYPKTFNAEINMTALNITAGTTYAYVLTDKGSGALANANVYELDSTGGVMVRCFTTTGSVPCTNTPPANPNGTLDASSFTLTPQAEAADPNNPGKYFASFGITPNVTLYAPEQVTMKIYSETGGGPVFLKEGTFPIPVGTGTTYPTVEDLVPGNYSAILYSGATQVSGEVGFTIGGTPGAPGGANAAFTYTGNPSVVCDSTPSICEFKVGTNVTTTGTLKFTLRAYPSIYAGVNPDPNIPGVDLVDTGDITATIGAGQITVSMAYNDFKQLTSPSNPDFLYYFHEERSGKDSLFGPMFSSSGQGVPIGTATADKPIDFETKPTDATGTCGAAAGTKTPALTSSSATLCATGSSVVEFNYDGFNYSWKCKGSDGTMRTCNASGGTDTNYGDGYLKNFLAPGLDTFPKIFAAVYNNIILPVAVPFIVIAIMFAGFKFVIARKEGRVDGYADAKRVLKYTLIGTGLLLGGWVIANALSGTISALLGPEAAKPTAVMISTDRFV